MSGLARNRGVSRESGILLPAGCVQLPEGANRAADRETRRFRGVKNRGQALKPSFRPSFTPYSTFCPMAL
jgi:hypothetical protein